MNHIEPKQVRALAYKMLLLSECIHLDDLAASQEALEAVQELRKELEKLEGIAKRAVRIHEKEERTRWR